ncbi:GGDEF domain-containing protein [Psychrobacillus sp. FSL K6-4615]|uniref:GGDEF domain-containing protein n=1 Tax=Psychrobacillus sp. FSL K6-4615 TaxID=2921551 RepID=UPI0030F75E88
MKIFSIDIIALPLLYLPTFFILLSVLSYYLYSKTKRRTDVLYSSIMLLLALCSLILFQAATGERLYFWSTGFHLGAFLVFLAIATRRFLLTSKNKVEQWPLAVVLSLLGISFFFHEILAGAVVIVVFMGYGGYLLYLSRLEQENSYIQGILLMTTALFIVIGQWLPFNGGRFIFSVMLLILMTHEVIRFFERVLGMMQAAGLNSVTDGLTGLFNKRFLYSKLNQLIHQEEVSVIFADIDNFKRLNDTQGHDVGDQVLIQVGKILKELVGNKGYVCRFGGEEMVGIVTQGNERKLAENFRSKVEELTIVTVSVGVASNEEEKEVNALIKKADVRMYSAKTTGKNKVIYSD